MSGASFLDANILVYTDDHDTPEKQAIALALVEAGQANRDAFVSTQTLEEYFSAATKKLKVPAAIARGKVELFAQLQVVLITVDDVLRAIDIHRLHQISFWDAAGTDRPACGLHDAVDRRLAGWEAIRRSCRT
jgi:predicted nucleic acid-binding protein